MMKLNAGRALAATTLSTALGLSGLVVGTVPTLAQETKPAAANAELGCEEGRKLFFFAYWNFMRNNPQCVPDIDDDAFYTQALSAAGSGGAACKSTRSYGSHCRYGGSYRSRYGSIRQ